MSRNSVACIVTKVHIESENPGFLPKAGVRVTCGRCGHTSESYGTSDRSVRRCLALLHEECPQGEFNFYERAGEQEHPDPSAAYDEAKWDHTDISGGDW